ncbi:hypothetical protein AYI70_g11480 [Smittium culicis]|uniref:Uncharacterized protein n=1 Tax=Smittium culicis TaxID=133412 RepID=A0A1R1X1P1_9FUNG|nr:hypothetical protein AYI70_g11480 [Smittium culicis]
MCCEDFQLLGSAITFFKYIRSVWVIDRLNISGKHFVDFHKIVISVIFSLYRLTFCTTCDIKFHAENTYGFLRYAQSNAIEFVPIALISGSQLKYVFKFLLNLEANK